MENLIVNRLISSITKYESGIYSEDDFHKTIESIRNSANETSNLFSFLTDIENELEKIDFLVVIELRAQEYLKQVNRIEHFLQNNKI